MFQDVGTTTTSDYTISIFAKHKVEFYKYLQMVEIFQETLMLILI
jgi:hypothetical protein